MEIEQKQINEEENHFNYIMDEQTFSKFSREIFKFPIFGILCGLYLNFVYIYNWKKNKNIFSLMLILYINYLIIEIILKNILKIEEVKENEDYKKINMELEIKKRREIFRKIISLEDPGSTMRSFIYTYLCLIISRLLGDKFIIFFILNILIFYAPINNKFPNFIFNTIMFIKQTIESIFGIIECFIPRYVEKKEKNN